MSSEAFAAWDKFTVNALKKELETRNASVKTLTPKEQLINRLIRIEAGTALDDDIVAEVPHSHPPPRVPSQPVSDYGMTEDDDVALLPRNDPTAEVDEFGIDSDDDAFEELAIKVESPSLKRSAAEDSQSPAKRQCKLGATSTPAYPMTSTVARNTLRTCFGLQEFRLKQEAAIARLLAGGNAVVVFPTGGGKSLCYQVPAFSFAEADRATNSRGEAEGGITLVVSPLIALMKDQVDALKRRGLSAACLDSTKSKEEYLETMESMRNGTLKLLYCAPERLNNEGFVASIRNCRGGVRLVAVDEAHCVSEWGASFRPDYLKVARFVKEIRAERTVCLTATATPKVVHDICDAFDIDGSGLFRTTTFRPNLRLLVEAAATKEDVYPGLFKLLKQRPGSTIIYITTQQQTEDLAKRLVSKGFKAKAFHAGMEASVKTHLQDEFMASDELIMVATIAFGMGVDKANIRNIIHFDIPRSLEGYSQEIGRAGRDSKDSMCLLYLCGEDLHLKESFARGDLPSKESVRKLLQDIFDGESRKMKPGHSIERKLYQQSREYDIRPTTLNTIYAQLELRYDLIRATTPKYEGYSYIVQSPGDFFADKSRQAAAIASSSTKAAKWSSIDIDATARTHNLTRWDLIGKLSDWAGSGAIELKTTGVISVYRVMKQLPGTPAELEIIVSDLYKELEAREQQELGRIQDVIRLVTGQKCFAAELARHFGDNLPDDKKSCENCTWCETHQAVKLITPPAVAWDRNRFAAILAAVPERDDARYLTRVAFGIVSPRVTANKLNCTNSTVFGSMSDHPFEKLLNAFTAACATSNQRGSAGTLQTPPTRNMPGSATKGKHNPPTKRNSTFARKY